MLGWHSPFPESGSGLASGAGEGRPEQTLGLRSRRTARRKSRALVGPAMGTAVAQGAVKRSFALETPQRGGR